MKQHVEQQVSLRLLPNMLVLRFLCKDDHHRQTRTVHFEQGDSVLLGVLDQIHDLAQVHDLAEKAARWGPSTIPDGIAYHSLAFLSVGSDRSLYEVSSASSQTNQGEKALLLSTKPMQTQLYSLKEQRMLTGIGRCSAHHADS